MPHELIIKACESLRERVSALRDVDRHLVNIEFLATCVVVRLQIEQLIELERILMPRLNDVLVQANTTIQAQNAQIANLQNQLATAQAGRAIRCSRSTRRRCRTPTRSARPSASPRWTASP